MVNYMIEVKPYLINILKSIDEHYEAEKLSFELTKDGYMIKFEEEVSGSEDDENNKGRRGEWIRPVEISVKLGEKVFKPYGFNNVFQDICPCKNCSEEVEDKDKIAPSS